jgi:hypothetical protein
MAVKRPENLNQVEDEKVSTFFKYFFLIQTIKIRDLEKLILLRVLYFDLFGDKGKFIETNTSLKRVFGKSIVTVSSAVNSLEKKGMIEVERKSDGISRRAIYFDYTYFKTLEQPERKLTGDPADTLKDIFSLEATNASDLKEDLHQNILIENNDNININKQSGVKENFNPSTANPSFLFDNKNDQRKFPRNNKGLLSDEIYSDFQELIDQKIDNRKNTIIIEGILVSIKEVKNKYGKGNFCNMTTEDINGTKLYIQVNEMLYSRHKNQLNENSSKSLIITGELFYNQHLKRNSLRAKQFKFSK